MSLFGGQGDIMADQPRYEAYKSTTENPTNWGFMSFIANMKAKYVEFNNLRKDNQGYSSIDDHDRFTNFIILEVSNDQKSKKSKRLCN